MTSPGRWLRQVVIIAWMQLVARSVDGAPPRDVTANGHQVPARDSAANGQQGDIWLSDGTFYDFGMLGDQSNGGRPGPDDFCPPVAKKLSPESCHVSSCSSDRDCVDSQLRCCYNGCVYTCLPEVKAAPHFDWIQEPVRRLQFGQSWLVPGPNENVNIEMCSTTPLDDDSDPLVCPHGYECSIDDVGSPETGVPNRGHCVRVMGDPGMKSVQFSETQNDEPPPDIHDDTEMVDTAMLHACHIGDGQMLISGHSLVLEQQKCFCLETVLSCEDIRNKS